MIIPLMISGSDHDGYKQPLLGSFIANNQPMGIAPFRIRRNKWSILKLVLILAFLLYILICLKSLFLDAPYENKHSVTISDSWVRHSELLRSKEKESEIEKQQSSPQSSSSYSRKKLRLRHHRKHESHSNSTLSTPYSNGRNIRPYKKKKYMFETRKQRLDEQLQTLMPVVSGWGEHGKPVKLATEEEKEKAAKQFKQAAYNVYISDRISPNRTLKRVSAKECYEIKYDVDELPNVSVVIIFTDEVFSALVRTVWSVINRTPKNLLREIILVDDHSERAYLKQTLRDYIDIYWNTLTRYKFSGRSDNSHREDELVKLIHLPERKGLIKARLEGARIAVGDTLLFLDSHCEVTETWAEPLLQRIKDDPKVFICPVIDIINDRTLEYSSVDPYFFQLGGFDWTGHFTWINRRNSEARTNPTKPAKTPTMAGGLFAVDRKYFFDIGSYDEDMKIWGGENLEISFRVWQCGGRVEIHPCSHVGHIFRDFHPYSFEGIDSHGFNTLRTVLTWMDDYSRYFFMSRPDLLKKDSGNLTSRKELRNKLNCQSFEWYLKNVYDGRKFVYDHDVQAYGRIENRRKNLCIDILNKPETFGENAGLYICEEMEHPLKANTNQLFSLSNNNQIRREEGCLTMQEFTEKPDHTMAGDTSTEAEDVTGPVMYQNGKRYVRITMTSCIEPDYETHSVNKQVNPKDKRKQIWRYEPISESSRYRLIISELNDLCLTTEIGSSESDLVATECDWSDQHQYWRFQVHLPSTSTSKTPKI